jgi:hypothetical protein
MDRRRLARAATVDGHLCGDGGQSTRLRWDFFTVSAARRFCRVHDEVRNFLRPRSRRNEVVSLAQRRLLYTTRTRVLLTSLAAA